MKKIVVMSDNHGEDSAIVDIQYKESDADYYVHCGDSEASPDLLEQWIVVAGNNDWGLPYDEYKRFEVEGLSFFVVHGHQFGYYEREEKMVDLLKEYHCDVLLSGHTHVPMFEQKGNFTLINPGSTTLPRRDSNRSYCVLYVDGDNLKYEFKEY
ncbi:MAG: metallophosphoesterase [Thomasclavelia sp.]|nr:metallophosphoesterase [Thomasclavelia sp.]